MYPGNPDYEVEEFFSQASGSRSSKITMSTHFGTHIDAPRHAVEGGAGVDALPLTHFYGDCRVIDATAEKESISRELVEGSNVQQGERILFKTTNSARGLDTFYSDFVFVSASAAAYLAQQNVALVGIDFYSIKQKGSTDNRPHTELLSKNIPILEGINLSAVSPGTYTLICFPLALVGLDGSPCRAVLSSQ